MKFHKYLRGFCKGVDRKLLLKIAVCDDEAIHRLIIRDKLDKFAISNDVDY